VAFGSPAQEAGLDWDQTIIAVQAPIATPSRYWIFVPAFLLLGLLIWAQRRRAGASETPQPRKDARHA
jgi:hypothetical protein